jgi:cellulose biosynthesis protein BcsQ
MSVPVLTFFNNKGGVGKTSLVYHLAWMYANLGLRVVAADLDPQANLTSAFLNEEQLEEIFDAPEGTDKAGTIFTFVAPLRRGTGDIAEPRLYPMEEEDRLAILVGDLRLSSFEDQLSESWPKCLDKDERAFRVTSAFWRIMQQAATMHEADVILVDLGPNLGAINRSALISTDYVVIPLAPDLFSLQGLHNLGPTLRSWRVDWQERVERNPAPDLMLPPGTMQPIGYVVLQHAVRLDRPVKAYDRWIARIPQAYRHDVLAEAGGERIQVREDPYALALLKNYGSLMPMAQEAQKPMFYLKSADGAIGSHLAAVQSVYKDFRQLARDIAKKIGLTLP